MTTDNRDLGDVIKDFGVHFQERVRQSVERQEQEIAALTPEKLVELHHEALLENQRLNSERLRDFEIPPVFKHDVPLLPEIRQWIRDFRKGGHEFYAAEHSLCLHGIPGSGKTHNAWQIVKLLLRRYSLDVRFVEVTALLQQLTTRGANDVDILRDLQLKSRDLLVLDDLGAERLTDARREKLEQLLDSRWKYQRPIVVTTNIPGSEFSERFGGRAASRLAGMCRSIVFPTVDHRRTKKAEPVGQEQGVLG